MRDAVAALKLLSFAFLILLFFLLQMPTLILLRCGIKYRIRRYANAVTCLLSNITLFCFNIKVRITGARGQQTTYLNASNHLSYLDALIYFATFPSCFITSQEIAETPFLGAICKSAGCLFVERRNRKGLRREMEEVALALKNGIPVTVFPEATSTDARSVLPFKRPAFRAALMAQRPVLPLALNYRTIGGQPFGLANRDRICWYGDMAFFPHFWSLLRSERIEAEIHVSPPLPFTPGQTDRELATQCHQRVASSFCPIAPT